MLRFPRLTTAPAGIDAMHARLVVWIGVALLLCPATLWTWSQMRIANESRPRATAKADPEPPSWSPQHIRIDAEPNESRSALTERVAAEPARSATDLDARARRSGGRKRATIRASDLREAVVAREAHDEIDPAGDEANIARSRSSRTATACSIW